MCIIQCEKQQRCLVVYNQTYVSLKHTQFDANTVTCMHKRMHVDGMLLARYCVTFLASYGRLSLPQFRPARKASIKNSLYVDILEEILGHQRGHHSGVTARASDC
jgi:hypothetical protein